MAAPFPLSQSIRRSLPVLTVLRLCMQAYQNMVIEHTGIELVEMSKCR